MFSSFSPTKHYRFIHFSTFDCWRETIIGQSFMTKYPIVMFTSNSLDVQHVLHGFLKHIRHTHTCIHPERQSDRAKDEMGEIFI